MAKIIITILVAIVIIDAVIAYACCAVAGRADDVAELERVRADLDAGKAQSSLVPPDTSEKDARI